MEISKNIGTNYELIYLVIICKYLILNFIIIIGNIYLYHNILMIKKKKTSKIS